MPDPVIELSTVEQLVVLAILRLQPNAYGIAIADHIEAAAQRTFSTGTIYAALDRLKARGFLQTAQGEPVAERGGRRKLFFFVTSRGRHALDRSLQPIDALREALGHRGALA